MGVSGKGEHVVPDSGLLEQSLDIVAQGLVMTRLGLTMEMVMEGGRVAENQPRAGPPSLSQKGS